MSTSDIYITGGLAMSKPLEVFRIGHPCHGHNLNESYLMDDVWCLHLYEYEADLWINEQHISLKPKDLTLIPPGQRIRYRYLQAQSYHYYVLFRAPGSSAEIYLSQHYSLPPLQHRAIELLLRTADNQDALHPFRARSAVAEVLWQLYGLENETLSSPFEKAVQIIRQGLQGELIVAHIAEEVALSPNQLTRIFQKEVGCTVIHYIRQQRMELARQLLAETSMAIGHIGQECGMHDPQYFNKTVRAFYGKSPKALRRELQAE